MEERLQKSYKGSQKIVLADDDSDDRELFLEAANFVDPDITITMAKDGEELMDCLLIKKQRPDLIFLDLNMPRKNGKECLIEIRKDKIFKTIPIIIYTTSLNPQDVEETFNHGAEFFLRKPNTFEELKEMLNMVLTTAMGNANLRIREKFVLNGTVKKAHN